VLWAGVYLPLPRAAKRARLWGRSARASATGGGISGDLVPALAAWDALHMKRTNLVLREDLLEEATRLSGEKTYSRTVDRALEEFVRRFKARQILQLAGSGTWEGDLGTMRADKPRRSGRRR
jgi:hypothetical protein